MICNTGKTENGLRKVPIADKVLPFYKAWYEGSQCEYMLHTIVTVRRIFSDEPAENGTGTVPHFGGFPFPFVPDLCSVRTRYSCRPRLYLAQLN